MAGRSTDLNIIESTLKSLRNDESLAHDMPDGSFLDKDGWVTGLPQSTQALIYAVEKVGDRPARPEACSDIAEQYLTKWESSKKIEDLDSAIALRLFALKYTRPDDPQRASRLDLMAFACQIKWEQSKSDHDLDITAHFFNRAAIVANKDDPLSARYHTNLAFILSRRWSLSKRPKDRKNAKKHFTKATELPSSHPMFSQMLSNYGEFIRQSVEGEEISRASALKEAIQLQERAVESLRPNLPVPVGTIWRNLGIASHDLFKITLDEKLSERIIECYRQAISLTAQKSQSIFARNEFAEHYLLRYGTWHRSDDIVQALQLYDTVLEIKDTNFAATIGKANTLRIMASEDENGAESRVRICDACRLAENSIELVEGSSQWRGWAYFRTSEIYSIRYGLDGGDHFLDRAVELSRLSLQYSKHQSFSDFGRWCGELCQSRYDRTGSPEDLAQAFRAVQGAIQVLDKQNIEALASCYCVLGRCYNSKYRSQGRPEDLEAALKWLEAACNQSSKQVQISNLMQNELANTLHHKFCQTFDIHHLDRAIDTYAQCLSSLREFGLPSDHDNFAIVRTGIGIAMIERFDHWSSQDDLISAIEFFRSCVHLTSPRNPRYATRVCNLSWSLQLMFNIQKDVSILREAQSYLLTVLDTTVDHGSEVLSLAHCHMGSIYLFYYENSKNSADLDSAIEQYDKVETLSDADNRNRAVATNNKAQALHKKALSSGHLQTYLDSIAKFDDAVKMQPITPSQLLTTALNKAETLRDMYEQFHDAESGQAALREYSQLTRTDHAQMHVRLRAATAASGLEVSLNGDYLVAYTHMREALDTLPRAILLFSNRLEQLRLLRKYHTLPSNGTAFAIAAGIPPAQILANLEQSRTSIWERYLILETPMKALREQHEQLANEFERLRSILRTQKPSESDRTIRSALPPRDQLRLERHTNTQSYDDIVAKIRKEKGFEHFPLTHALDDFSVGRDEAIPIVYINLNPYRCDALIASWKGVKILALTDLKMDDVFTEAAQLHVAQLELSKNFPAACTKFEQVMLWLWRTIAQPVLECLDRDGLINGDTRNKRVFWISSGWLSMFPIHVAGDWTSDRRLEIKPSVQERCISSYIPSIKALDFLRRRSEHFVTGTDERKALLVGMPATPGMSIDSDLNADVELASIRSLIDEAEISTHVLLSPLPTTRAVQSALAECEIAHFACHGCADPDDPSKSALRFADWQKTPFNVRTLLNMKLERCQLVVLSACETAANKDVRLQDQGLHIAGAFNMAGVPHAVAGMWKIDDATSVKLARAFYASLFQDRSRLRYTTTATALHFGIESLRAKGVHPLLWGAFIHMGP